ncbi:MAG TPA: hypothetical protein VGM67_05065 [Gemmatimonadaceae bacterium]|jgi:hypothetical protein
MVNITIQGDRVHFDVEGWDKVWALKSHLDIPLAHITGVRYDPEAARGWWHGLRLPGTDIPGLITAGSFYQKDGMVFYDVHHPDSTIVIDLDHEHYQKLIIEVEHPDMAVSLLRSALDRQR